MDVWMIFDTYQNDFNMKFPGANFFFSFNLFVQEISRKIS